MSKLTGPELQQHYKELINGKRFAELARLLKTGDAEPADYVIRMGYKNYIEEPQGKRVKLFYIMKLKELTGIPPDANVLKAACEVALKMDAPEALEALVKRVGIEQDLFSGMNSILQRTYTAYVEEGKFVDISKLMEITGTQPSEHIIQKGYEDYLQEGKFISFSGLKKRTGVKPDPDIVQEMFNQYNFNYLKAKTSKKDEAQDWVDRMKKLRRISKSDPEGFEIPEDEDEPEAPADG